MNRLCIVGATRSGTSLAQAVLSKKLGLVPLPESHIFTRGFTRSIAHFRVDRSALFAATEEFVDALPSPYRHSDCVRNARENLQGVGYVAPDDYVNAITSLFDSVAAAAGAPGWIEKTPAHCTRCPLIRLSSEPIAIVHMARSAVPTIRSRRKASMQWGSEEALIRSVVHWIAASLISSVRVGYSEQVIDFHNLIDRPDQVVDELVRALKLEPSDWRPKEADLEAIAPPSEPWRARALLNPDSTRSSSPSGILDSLFYPRKGARLRRSLLSPLCVIEPKLAR